MRDGILVVRSPDFYSCYLINGKPYFYRKDFPRMLYRFDGKYAVSSVYISPYYLFRVKKKKRNTVIFLLSSLEPPSFREYFVIRDEVTQINQGIHGIFVETRKGNSYSYYYITPDAIKIVSRIGGIYNPMYVGYGHAYNRIFVSYSDERSPLYMQKRFRVSVGGREYTLDVSSNIVLTCKKQTIFDYYMDRFDYMVYVEDKAVGAMFWRENDHWMIIYNGKDIIMDILKKEYRIRPCFKFLYRPREKQ